ncbi:MAG: M56 family metallopeptidase, partial [Phycisphaerales bacterium]
MESLNMQLQPFFEWLVRTTLQASLLICLILLLQTVLRGRLGVRWHYCLWLLLLVRMALPWTPQSRASLFNLIPQRVPQRQTEYAQQDTVEQSAGSDVASAGTGESPPASTTSVAQDSRETVTVIPQRSKEAKGQLKSALFGLAGTLPLVWLAGALALAVYVCASNFNLLRIVKRRRPLTDQKILDLLEDCKSQMGIRIILGVVTTDKVKSPALFGFVRPRLLLPEGMIEALDREELRYVFLHELAHLKRHDIYIGWLMSLLQVLHWFNPLVWLAFYRMRADRELACDALVLARTRSDESKSYGRIIVSLLERFSRSQPLPAMAGILETKAQLKRRITMITKFKKNSYQWSPLAVILIIILACVSLPDAKHTKASETSAARPPGMVVRRVWIDAADPYFMGAPSPDGKYISYVDWNTADLAIHELATGKNRRLTNEGWGKGRPTYSIFSPDSKYVACRWRGRDVGGLRIIRLDGSERRFIKHPEGITILRPTNWSTDGKHILAFGGAMWDDSDDAFKYLKILLVSVEDGDARVLKTIECLAHRKRSERLRMSLSPDGQYVAYSFPPADNSGKGDIWVFGTDGGPEIQVVEHPADDFVLSWSPDGSRIVFASDRTGSMGIWAIDVAEGRTQGTPQLLKSEIGRFQPLGLTQDGSFYYGIFAGGNNVYTAPFDPQKGNITAKPVIAVHRYEGSNWAPDWSPDGRYLACLSSGPGVAPRLIIQSMETGEVREITPELREFNVHSLRWSADGRSLLGAGSAANGPWGALQIDVKTGEVTTIVQGPALRPESAPDGKAIFYIQNLAEKGGRIVRRELKSQEEKELYGSREFISALTLSSDGKQLAFSKGGALIVLAVEGGETRELVKVKGKITIAWAPDGRHLVYGTRGLGEGPGQLWRIPAEGGKPQKLDLEMPYLDHVRFHPDGRKTTFTGESQKEKVEVWVMENFLPEAPVAK